MGRLSGTSILSESDKPHHSKRSLEVCVDFVGHAAWMFDESI
jgi:hypothetical protein